LAPRPNGRNLLAEARSVAEKHWIA